MLVFLGSTDLHQSGLHYRIDQYVEDGGGHRVPLGHPPLRFKRLAVVSPGPRDHRLVIPVPLEKPLEIRAKAVSPQDFHAPCSVQRVIGLPHIEEHLEQGFMVDACQLWCQSSACSVAIVVIMLNSLVFNTDPVVRIFSHIYSDVYLQKTVMRKFE